MFSPPEGAGGQFAFYSLGCLGDNEADQTSLCKSPLK